MPSYISGVARNKKKVDSSSNGAKAQVIFIFCQAHRVPIRAKTFINRDIKVGTPTVLARL